MHCALDRLEHVGLEADQRHDEHHYQLRDSVRETIEQVRGVALS